MKEHLRKNRSILDIRKLYPVFIALVALLVVGCATMEKSILLGAATVGATGTAIGLAAGQNTGSAVLGLGVGALLGGTMGLLAHKDREEKEALLKLGRKGKDLAKDLPTLLAAKASCTKVGESIQGTRYVGPHLVCEIEKPAVWSR